jgi:ribonuclease-3
MASLLRQNHLIQRHCFTPHYANSTRTRHHIPVLARNRGSVILTRRPVHPVQRSRIKLDPSAHEIAWDACTVRGFEDGSLVFKFDQLDPRIEAISPQPSSLNGSTASKTSTASTMPKATLANFAWSNAVKLGVKFPQQLETTLKKLEEYLIEFNGRTAPARVELNYSLFKTYQKAVERQEKLLINEVIVAGIEEMMLHEKDKEGKDGGESGHRVADVFAVGAATPHHHLEKEEKKTKVFIFNLLHFCLSTIQWVVHLPLTLYRCLPYGFRKLFHSAWPPKLPAATRHISPSIAALFLENSGFNRTSLADAGFDAQGRCAALAPLSDVPAWKIEQLVGCGIGNVNLYRSALTHSTALPPEARALSYERLEFLGDAVLELCTRQLVMERAPNADEGVLTNQGQFLVAGSTVNKYGAWMGLDKWVLCNAYSMRDGLIGSPHVLGDVFEALLGCLYVDRGLEAARKFLIRVFTQCPSVEWDKIGFLRDYKGELIKIAHQRRKPIPVYNVLSSRLRYAESSSGNSGNGSTSSTGSNGTVMKKKYWTVEVEFDGEVIGSGSNFEKRQAEAQAAKAGLINLGELLEEEEESLN